MSLRVVFITQEDPFHIAEYFRAFFADARSETGIAEIVGGWMLATLGQKDSAGLARRMYGLYGPAGFMRLGTRYAMQRARAAVHDVTSLGAPVLVRQIFEDAGVRAQSIGDVNGREAIERIREQRPDVLLSISATQRFHGELLSIAPKGCFNSHSGDLPRFRGFMPTFWTLYENVPQATVTIHKMAEKIDAGGIWRQSRIPIRPEDSLNDVIQRTKRLSAAMTWTLLEELSQGDVELQPNDESQKSYYKFPGAKESAELRRRGRRLL